MYRPWANQPLVVALRFGIEEGDGRHVNRYTGSIYILHFLAVGVEVAFSLVIYHSHVWKQHGEVEQPVVIVHIQRTKSLRIAFGY